MKAVCSQCGEFKESAWITCDGCNFRPNSEREKAQGLLLSTHFNSEKKLKQFATHIRSGKELDFKEKDLAVVTDVLKTRQDHLKEQKKHIMKLAASFLLTIIFMVFFYYYKTSK